MDTKQFKKKYIKKQRDLSQKNITPVFPKIVKIDICNTCNYSCVFCPQSKQFNKRGCIDKELCYKIIKEAYDAGARELCLSMTGEPLLNLELEAYILFAKKLGYEYVFFNTNGYLLNKNRIEKILEAGIDSVKFSVNSSQRNYKLVHGIDGWNTVVQNIILFNKLRKLKNYKCKLYISCVAIKQTLSEIEDIRNVFNSYVDEIIIMNANNRGGSISEIEKKLYIGEDEYSFQYPCSQLFNNVYVTAEGYLIICCQDFENLTVVADLHNESISSAWTNECFTNFRERYLSHKLDGTLCRNCLCNTNESVVPLNHQVAYYEISETKLKNLEGRIKQLEE